MKEYVRCEGVRSVFDGGNGECSLQRSEEVWSVFDGVCSKLKILNYMMVNNGYLLYFYSGR